MFRPRRRASCDCSNYCSYSRAFPKHRDCSTKGVTDYTLVGGLCKHYKTVAPSSRLRCIASTALYLYLVSDECVVHRPPFSVRHPAMVGSGPLRTHNTTDLHRKRGQREETVSSRYVQHPLGPGVEGRRGSQEKQAQQNKQIDRPGIPIARCVSVPQRFRTPLGLCRSYRTLSSRGQALSHVGSELLGLLLGQYVDDCTAVQPLEQRGELLVSRLRIYAFDLTVRNGVGYILDVLPSSKQHIFHGRGKNVREQHGGWML